MHVPILNQRELLALPTGVLSLKIALRLVPAASAADSEGLTEYETDMKGRRAWSEEQRVGSHTAQV